MTSEEYEIKQLNEWVAELRGKVKTLEEARELSVKTIHDYAVALTVSQKKNSKLYGDISDLELKLENEVQKARENTAKTIFQEMYDTVSFADECTIIVTADDVKAIAKRYGVRVG